MLASAYPNGKLSKSLSLHPECSVHADAVTICFSILNLFLDISNSSFVQFQVSTILSLFLLYLIQVYLISLIAQILLFL